MHSSQSQSIMISEALAIILSENQIYHEKTEHIEIFKGTIRTFKERKPVDMACRSTAFLGVVIGSYRDRN